MSSETAISMRELEAESVELLPSRETLCAPRCGGGHGGSTTVTSQSYDGNGILNIANGSNFLNNISVNVLSV
jgi:hypothetical protein